MSRKIWFVAALVLLLCGAAGVAWWWLKDAEPSRQTVTLPNGITYRLVGATYGTNHLMGLPLGMAIQRMPKPLANIARLVFGGAASQTRMHTSSKPVLCVWFEPLNTNGLTATTTTVYAILADESGTLSGDRANVSVWGGMSVQWLQEEFSAIPRRSRMLECSFFETLPTGEYRSLGSVKFVNPILGEFPQWQPEPLPATKSAGDLDVVLESFTTGHGHVFETASLPAGKSSTRVSTAKPGEETRASFELGFKSPRGTNEVWSIESAELSDATGNHLPANSRTESGRRFAISPAPWPSEHAWKLRLELERKGAFPPEDLVVVRSIQIPAMGETNVTTLSNSLSGVQFKSLTVIRKPDITGNSWSSGQATSIQLKHTKVPKGYSLDFVQVMGQNGVTVETLSRGWSEGYSQVTLKFIPPGVESVDITYAVQQTRTVEFMVKPNPAASEKSK